MGPMQLGVGASQLPNDLQVIDTFRAPMLVSKQRLVVVLSIEAKYTSAASGSNVCKWKSKLSDMLLLQLVKGVCSLYAETQDTPFDSCQSEPVTEPVSDAQGKE